MEEFLKNLSGRLRYISHEYLGTDTVRIVCETERGNAVCPYCGYTSSKVDRRYRRVLKDVPFGGKKVVLVILFNNYLCKNNDCRHHSFAEKVDFAEPFATRTNRLDKQILELAAGNSGIGAERFMRRNFADVSDTTINRIIKKNSKTHSGG